MPFRATVRANFDGSTTTIVDGTNKNGEGTKTITVKELDGTIKEHTATKDKDGNVAESARLEKTNGDYTTSSLVKNADGTTEEASASRNTDKNMVVTEKEDTRAADGSTTDYDKVTQPNEDYKETFVARDKDGNITEERSASHVTDAATGDVTEKSYTKDATGSTESEMTTKGDGSGDFFSSKEVRDPDGKIIFSETSSRETDAEGNVTLKTETCENGVETVTTEVQKPDNSNTLTQTITQPNGDKSEETVEKDGKGAVNITGSETEGGETSKYVLTGTENGLTVQKDTGAAGDYVLNDQFEGADGKTYPVTAIGDKAFERNTELISVAFGEGIKTIGKNAFAGCANLKEIRIGTSVETKAAASQKNKNKSKIELRKNCLKGTSKKLKIYVRTKADKKAVKKQLKKAGNRYAKVKI